MNTEIKFIIQGERLGLLSKLTLTDNEYEIMSNYLSTSTYVWTGSVDGNLCCLLGAISGSLICDTAYIWFLHTSEFDRYKFVFARRSRDIIQTLLGQYPVLVGHCVRSNRSSRRWIRWLGAKFAEPIGEALPFEIRAR
jgi:hypothetical protein